MADNDQNVNRIVSNETPAGIAAAPTTNNIGLDIDLAAPQPAPVPPPVQPTPAPVVPPTPTPTPTPAPAPTPTPVPTPPPATPTQPDPHTTPAGIPSVPPTNTTTIDIDIPEPTPSAPPARPNSTPVSQVADISNVGVTATDTALRSALTNNGARGVGVGVSAVTGKDSVNDASGVFLSGSGTAATRDGKTGVTVAGTVGALNHGNDNITAYGIGGRVHRTVYDGASGRTNLHADLSGSYLNGVDETKNGNVVKSSTTVGVGATHTFSNNKTTANIGYQHQTGTTYDGRKSNANQIGLGVQHSFNNGAFVGGQASIGAGGNADATAVALTAGWSNRQQLGDGSGTKNPLKAPPIPPENLQPPPAAPEVKAINIRLGEKELFAHDSATISETGKQRLNELVAKLRDPNMLSSGKSIEQMLRESGQHIDLFGNTDATGSNAYNQRLSESRANNVMRYLQSQGIDPSIMKATGNGETAAKFDDSAVAAMRRAGRSRSQIHAAIQEDRNVTVSIPGEYTLRNNDSKHGVAETLGGKNGTNVEVNPKLQEVKANPEVLNQAEMHKLESNMNALGVQVAKPEQEVAQHQYR